MILKTKISFWSFKNIGLRENKDGVISFLAVRTSGKEQKRISFSKKLSCIEENFQFGYN